MKNGKKTKHKTNKEIIHNNPKVDKSLVRNYENLERQLKKIGVDTNPKFNIEPPLGGSHYLFNK
ncbi:MAG: hypothetical protein GY928_15515 [Colwellia sp.]|nr:hypothetical protein [Colwellia sp.]